MRVSQLALHTSKVVLCARLQVVALHFSRKTFHHLPPPNLALAHLQSLAIILIHSQLCIARFSSLNSLARGILLFWSGALLLHSIWHLLAHMKGDVLCVSNHHANGSCNQAPGFLHTSRVYDLALLSPETIWSKCHPLL